MFVHQLNLSIKLWAEQTPKKHRGEIWGYFKIVISPSTGIIQLQFGLFLQTIRYVNIPLTQVCVMILE